MLVNKKILHSNVVHYCPFVMFKEVIEQYNKIYFYILQEIKTIIEELSDNPENK